MRESEPRTFPSDLRLVLGRVHGDEAGVVDAVVGGEGHVQLVGGRLDGDRQVGAAVARDEWRRLVRAVVHADAVVDAADLRARLQREGAELERRELRGE